MSTIWTGFPSAFDDSSTSQVDAVLASVAIPSPNIQIQTTNHPSSGEKALDYSGHLASFVFLVAGMEKSLREDDSSILFDKSTTFQEPRLPLGGGASFIVERAEWKSRSTVGLETSANSKWGKYVALKYVRRTMDPSKMIVKWKEVLLEIRALLHTPIRYHPNIVRLLGLSWGTTGGSDSVYPVLALEYAEYGSLHDLQVTSDPLSFVVKKKLCHDVSKGLSILHACGIVHGDLKHENVLVFRNKKTEDPIVYTAKLVDFGGSIMDLAEDQLHSLRMRTPPWNAPEYRRKLSPEELKLTDIYSLGLLVWRTILDAKSPFSLPEFTNVGEDSAELHEMKSLDKLLPIAQNSLRRDAKDLNDDSIRILDFVFENTMKALPQDRSLVKAMAGLQVSE